MSKFPASRRIDFCGARAAKAKEHSGLGFVAPRNRVYMIYLNTAAF